MKWISKLYNIVYYLKAIQSKMSAINLNQLIHKIVVANTTKFYKEWVIRSKGGDNYNTTEKYFKKNAVGKFQFETCWAFIQYKKWIESDTYITDIAIITKNYEDDMINGFDSVMEETIMMEDDDEDLQQKFIMMRDEFNLLKTNNQKMDYLSIKYNENMYYPNIFNDSWLFYLFEDRIISDI